MLPRLFRPQCLRASAHCAPRPGKKGEFDFSSVRRPLRSASSAVPDTSRAPKSSVTGAVATSRSDESRVCGISRRPRRSGLEHRIFFSAAGNGRAFLLPGSSPARPLGLLTSNGSDFNSRSTQCLPPSLQIFFAHQLGLPAGAEGRAGQAAATRVDPDEPRPCARAGRSRPARPQVRLLQESGKSVAAVVDICFQVLYLHLHHRVRKSRGRVENELPGAEQAVQNIPFRQQFHRRRGARSRKRCPTSVLVQGGGAASFGKNSQEVIDSHAYAVLAPFLPEA